MPGDFDSAIAKLGRDLDYFTKRKDLLGGPYMHGAGIFGFQKLAILEAIANECSRQALRLCDTGGDEPDRMGLYDDEMVVYKLLDQGWGHWLYTGAKAADEKLARSVVQMTLATCSICPGFDLNKRAAEAIASHCDTPRGRELVYPILERIVGGLKLHPLGRAGGLALERNWGSPLGRSSESVENLREIFNWISDDPAEPAQGDHQSAPKMSAAPPLNPVAVGYGSIRQAMMLYAILGPALTEDLIRAVAASGMHEGTLVELTTDLEELRVGKYPEMLLLMASAAYATAIADGWSHLEKSFPLLRGGYGPATKFLGDEIVEALRRFGVDPIGDREGYNRWLHSAVKDSQFPALTGILAAWDIPPDSEEDESEASNNTEGGPPRRRARLVDRFNRRVGNAINRLR